MTSVAAHERLVGGAVAPHPPGRAGFIGTVRSEFTKIWSVRSTYWTLIAMLIVCVGLGALFSWAATERLLAIQHGVRLNGGPIPAGQQHALLVQRENSIRSNAASLSLFG